MDDFDNGWDAQAVLVDGRWVDRTPRRPEVEAPLRRETILMPWLAPQLPLAVPVPTIASESPVTVRHRLIEGSPCPGRLAVHGSAVGEFIRALHAVPTVAAREMGVPEWDPVDTWPRFEREVLPLISAANADLAGPAEALLVRLAGAPRSRLVHGDLGPQHIRVAADVVTGVIDWTDTCIGDPALDLSWVLFGSEPAFAKALGAAYGTEDETVARAHDWHLLGPWHEVTYGLDLGDDSYVRSGLDGVLTRLLLHLRTPPRPPLGFA